MTSVVSEVREGRPRVAPGTRAQVGTLNWLIAAAIGLATGGAPPHIFTTLARHRRLFRAWLRFAGALMPRGTLPRADTELLILRVAHNCHCDYEWRHHAQIAQAAGLSAADVERVRAGGDGFGSRQLLLVRAADELHERREISDGLWLELQRQLSDVELIELCLLVGHYEMLAMTLNSLRVEPDPPATRARLRLLRRRRSQSGDAR